MCGNCLHLGGYGSVIVCKIGVVSARVYDAEVVACRGNIKGHLVDNGSLGIVEIDSNDTANCASDLIHKSAGLTEEDVLGILRELCDFNVIDLSVVIEVAEYVSYHILKSGGRGKSRAFENVGGGVSVKAADSVAFLKEARAHTCDDRRGRAEFCLVGCCVCLKINYVLREALALDADNAVLASRCYRDDIEVNRRRNYASVVVVCVVARELTSSCNRVESDLSVSAVDSRELVYSGRVTRLLCGNCSLTVDISKSCINSAGCDMSLHLSCVHDISP